MRNSVLNVFVSLLLLLPASIVCAQGQARIITTEQWNLPKQGVTIIGIPEIRATLEEFQQTQHSRILIKHPGGDVGTLWAYELRSWLVSLGVGSSQIELIPGTADPTPIELHLVKPEPN